jgi:hypothetical protein
MPDFRCTYIVGKLFGNIISRCCTYSR